MSKHIVPSPFDSLANMQREINRMFTNFYGGNGVFGVPNNSSGTLDMKMSVVETDKTIEVSAELPGVDVKDINVTLRHGLLTVKGEKHEEKEEKAEDYHLVERSYGSFSRSLTLPADVNEDKVDAKFEKGVLKISLTKASGSQSKGHKIEIKAV